MKEITEKDFYKWIGIRLKTLREKAGIKQKDVAEKVGIPPQFLSDVEKRGKKVSAYQINCILKAMNCTQADLMEETDDDVKKNSPLRSMAVAWAS